MVVAVTSGVPLLFKTTVEEILSGAISGTEIVTPFASLAVFNCLCQPSQLDFNKYALTTWLCRPGTTSLPSVGQLKTCKYSVVSLPSSETFFVQRPHGRRLNGLADVP